MTIEGLFQNKSQHSYIHLIGTYCIPITCMTPSRAQRTYQFSWRDTQTSGPCDSCFLPGAAELRGITGPRWGPASGADHMQNKRITLKTSIFTWLSKARVVFEIPSQATPKPRLRSFGWKPQAGGENPPPASHAYLEVWLNQLHISEQQDIHILKCSSLYSNVHSNIMMLLAT